MGVELGERGVVPLAELLKGGGKVPLSRLVNLNDINRKIGKVCPERGKNHTQEDIRPPEIGFCPQMFQTKSFRFKVELLRTK